MFRLFAATAATLLITSLATMLVTARRLEDGVAIDDWTDCLIDGDIMTHQ